MPKTTPEQNKTLVLEAFDTLFNKRDYAAAERFWSPDCIQHSAHIAPGRDSRGLDDGSRPTPWYREEGTRRRTDDSDAKSATNPDHEVSMTEQ